MNGSSVNWPWAIAGLAMLGVSAAATIYFVRSVGRAGGVDRNEYETPARIPSTVREALVGKRADEVIT